MDAKFMDRALMLAKLSAAEGEIPVGAVIVKDGEIIAEGRNQRESKDSVFSHAECEAIKNANAVLGDWRLEGCSIYVTLEPCMMCMGAIINARIDELVFGAFDIAGGAVEGNFRPAASLSEIKIFSGVRESECKDILTKFFKKRRKDV